MGSSLAKGIAAVPEGVDAALVCLGDMPRVRRDTIKRIVNAFAPWNRIEICVPVRNGRRGHPVLFGRRFFPDLRALSGDIGGRGLIEMFSTRVAEVAVDDDGIFVDYDTPEDFQ
jgi:molybdenum cofactor cytidylyltransferase